MLLDWRDSPRRLTRSDPRYRPERFLATKLEALAAGRWRGGRSSSGAPDRSASAGRGRSWRGARACSAFVEVDPRKLGSLLYGVPVVPVGRGGLVRATRIHLAAVGQPGARERIRAEAARLGLADGRDLFAVA